MEPPLSIALPSAYFYHPYPTYSPTPASPHPTPSYPASYVEYPSQQRIVPILLVLWVLAKVSRAGFGWWVVEVLRVGHRGMLERVRRIMRR